MPSHGDTWDSFQQLLEQEKWVEKMDGWINGCMDGKLNEKGLPRKSKTHKLPSVWKFLLMI